MYGTYQQNWIGNKKLKKIWYEVNLKTNGNTSGHITDGRHCKGDIFKCIFTEMLIPRVQLTVN